MTSATAPRKDLRGRLRLPSAGQLVAVAYVAVVLIWLFAPIAVIVGDVSATICWPVTV